MTYEELQDWTTQWAREAAQHKLRGDALRLTQNENYFRRVIVAHVPDGPAREALAELRGEVFQAETTGR